MLTTFSSIYNIQKSVLFSFFVCLFAFLLISPKLHRLLHIHLHTLLNMTQFLVPNSPYVWKKRRRRNKKVGVREWGFKSEQAPLKIFPPIFKIFRCWQWRMTNTYRVVWLLCQNWYLSLQKLFHFPQVLVFRIF